MLTLLNMSAVRSRCGGAAYPARASTSACTTQRATPMSSSTPLRRKLGAHRAEPLTCRVVRDPMASFDMDVSGSFDLGGSIDMDIDARRSAVERDTVAKLRETIAAMGGAQIMDPLAFVSTDEQRLLTAGLFTSCAALVLRGCVEVEMDGSDPVEWATLVAYRRFAHAPLSSTHAPYGTEYDAYVVEHVCRTFSLRRRGVPRARQHVRVHDSTRHPDVVIHAASSKTRRSPRGAFDVPRGA